MKKTIVFWNLLAMTMAAAMSVGLALAEMMAKFTQIHLPSALTLLAEHKPF